ncbi:MAG: hypothetical protein Q9211_006322 [Gyalolechia sp. 1 TL-2023]
MTENFVTDDERIRLSGWNTAWTSLKDDDLIEEGLEDLNAGQTHRERLQSENPPEQGSFQSQRSSFPTQHPPKQERFQSQYLPQPAVDPLEEARQFSREVRASNRSRGSGSGSGSGRGRGGRGGGRGGGYVGAAPSRHAQRRTPVGQEPAPHAQRQRQVAAVAGPLQSLEQQTAIPPIPRGQGSSDAGTAAASSSRPPKTELWNPNLVSPSEYMLAVYASTPSAAKGKAVASKVEPDPTNKSSSTASAAKGKAAATPESSSVDPTPKPESVQASMPKPNLPLANYPVASSTITGTLLDTSVDQTDNRAEILPSKSYAEDLMDVDFFQSDNLPAPIEFSTDVREEETQPRKPVAELGLREIDSQLASFLPVLQSELAPDAIEKLLWVKSQVQQKINKTNHVKSDTASQSPDTTLEESADLKQSAGSKDVITNTGATKGSIFGEHVTRSRAAERHNSTASVTSTSDFVESGLVEGIQNLKVRDDQPSIMPQAIESSQFARVNPFGPKSASKGQTSSSPHPAACRDNNGAAPIGHGSSNTDNQRTGRPYSVSSAGSSILSPGLGEAINRPRRASEFQAFQQPAPSGFRPFRPDFTSRYPPTTAGPRPPGFLANAPPTTVDPGAAARTQYEQGTTLHRDHRGPATTQAPATRAPSGLSQAFEHRRPAFAAGPGSSEPGSSSQMPRYTSGEQKPAFYPMTTRAPEVAGWIPKPSTSEDPAAASRAQYGGKENEKR